MQAIFRCHRDRYRPIGPVIDSIVVSNLVDKVVFVVRWASTARELVQQSVQRLPGHRKVAGIVFNQVNEQLARKYGRHASAYYGSGDYKKYYTMRCMQTSWIRKLLRARHDYNKCAASPESTPTAPQQTASIERSLFAFATTWLRADPTAPASGYRMIGVSPLGIDACRSSTSPRRGAADGDCRRQAHRHLQR